MKTVISIIPVAVLFLAAVIITVSLIASKKRLQRALEEGGDHSRKSGPDFATVFNVVVYAVILILLIVISNRITACENSLSAVNQSVLLLKREIQNLRYDWEESIQEDDSLLDGSDWSLKDCDFAQKTATLHISVRLKNYNADTAVTLDDYYAGQIPMQPLSGGIFEADVTNYPLFNGLTATKIIVQNNGTNQTESVEFLKREPGWYALPHLIASFAPETTTWEKKNTLCLSFNVYLLAGRAASFSDEPVYLITEVDGRITEKRELSAEAGRSSDPEECFLEIRNMKIELSAHSECELYLEAKDSEGFLHRCSVITAGTDGSSAYTTQHAEEKVYNKNGVLLNTFN